MDTNLPQELNNFLKDENTYLIPSRLSKADASKLLNFWKSCDFNSHAFITSSGTTSFDNIKSYALSYEAIKVNAYSVNSLINASSSDRWLSSLPIYHVGGLSIYARAILSSSEVISVKDKWNPLTFCKTLARENIQFCSIVPTQLHDIVTQGIHCPDCLKAIFVGGDYTPKVLYQKAIKLGWPIYITFGMTEVCSQLATASAGDYPSMLPVLNIHDVKLFDGVLGIKSRSLFSAYFYLEKDRFIQKLPNLTDGYFITQDLARIEILNKETLIRPLGRVGDEVKINARLVNLLPIKNLFADICDELAILNRAELVIVDDERAGKCFELWIENEIKAVEPKIKDGLSKKDIKIKRVKFFDKLARNHMGKLIKKL